MDNLAEYYIATDGGKFDYRDGMRYVYSDEHQAWAIDLSDEKTREIYYSYKKGESKLSYDEIIRKEIKRIMNEDT